MMDFLRDYGEAVEESEEERKYIEKQQRIQNGKRNR